MALLRTAMVALGIGAVGSVGLTLYAGQRVGAPRLLLVLFGIWVISPYVLLAIGHVVAKRRSAQTQAALAGVTVIVALASLIVYGAVSLGAPRPKTAVFVIVAPLSWLLIAVVGAAAALRARRASRQTAI